MSSEQVKEASWVVNTVTGASAYLHGVDYPPETFRKEVEKAVAHAREPVTAGA